MMGIDIAGLIESMPTELQTIINDFITAYGVDIKAMTQDEVMAFINDIGNGKTVEAHRALLEKKSDDDAIAEWDNLINDTAEVNADNAAAIAKQKEMLATLVKALAGLGVSLIVSQVNFPSVE